MEEKIMDTNKMIGKLAIWSFIGGTLLAIIIGIIAAWKNTLFVDYGWIAWILILLGAIVGVLAFLGKGTITKAEVPAFLTAGIALLVMYGVFKDIAWLKPYIGALLANVSLSLALFIVPAVGLLAIKAIYDIGKDV
jgi:hypothetical protein